MVSREGSTAISFGVAGMEGMGGSGNGVMGSMFGSGKRRR